MMSHSRDGGKTWETKDIKLPFMAMIAPYGGAIVLRDGTYVQPAQGIFELKKGGPDRVSSLALRTEDGGDHWAISTVAKGKDFDFNETSIAQAPNGDLVAVVRTTGQKELWTAISKDDGKTWSAPRDSGMRGSTPWVVTTDKGLVVAVYSRRETKLFPTTGMYACLSRDNGQSWDIEHQAMIRDNGSAFVDGYPQAVALPDGSVFAVYGLLVSVPGQAGSGKKASESKLNLSLPGQAGAGKKAAQNQLSIGGTRFAPIYQGPPVFSFDHAPGVLK
jgi:Neuraminidase (sialidase)